MGAVIVLEMGVVGGVVVIFVVIAGVSGCGCWRDFCVPETTSSSITSTCVEALSSRLLIGQSDGFILFLGAIGMLLMTTVDLVGRNPVAQHICGLHVERFGSSAVGFNST